MKNNNFDFLFKELSDEFESCIDRIKKYSHFEEVDYASCISQYKKHAQDLVEKYKNGYYVSNKGFRVNNKCERINDNGELIDEKITRKNIAIGYSENTMEKYLSGKKGDAYFRGDTQVYLQLSFVCSQWGIHLYHTGEHAKGRKFLIDALKFVNMWSGAEEALTSMDYMNECSKNKVKAASEGGKARAKSYAPLKAMVVELLKKHVPEGGWKTKTAAIDALEKDVTKFIEDEKIKISWHRTITDWSRNDKVIKATFGEVVKKKISAPKGAK